MIYGYARVSTDGQSVEAQVAELIAAGASKVFSETASRAHSDRAQLGRVVAALVVGDVLLVTRLDRLARSTRDLLNVLAAVAERRATFRSLGDAWADTTTPPVRLMLTVLGGLAEFERELIVARTSEGRVRARAGSSSARSIGSPSGSAPGSQPSALEARARATSHASSVSVRRRSHASHPQSK
jgi:DNA invertase Pin-like site-specific DNA recombinase